MDVSLVVSAATLGGRGDAIEVEISATLLLALDSVTDELAQVSSNLAEQENMVNHKVELEKSIPDMEQNLTGIAMLITKSREQLATLTATIKPKKKKRGKHDG